MKLNPEDLDVSSFETTAAAAAGTDTALQPIIITPNDPTAATWCYICPAETYNRCW